MKVIFRQYPIKIDKRAEKPRIYDIVRKKWVIMTSEEQVRQMWIHYLTQDLGYSLDYIAVEKKLTIEEKTKRFDICVYDHNFHPNILIECKSPDIPISMPTWEQVFTYNLALSATTFIITNGIEHRGLSIENNSIVEIDQVAKYER